jgi:hypothetical protein
MKLRVVSTIVTGLIASATVCASWGLTSASAEQQASNDELQNRTVLVENRIEEPEVGVYFEKDALKWLRFELLMQDWRKQRGASSSITKAVTSPAYQAIIGMGEPAVPIILAQIRSEGDDPDQWFWALECITQENPTLPEDRGSNLKMAKAWLAWGDEKNVG